MEISIRQHYAAFAMQAFLSGPEKYEDLSWISAQAFLMADQMIKAESVAKAELEKKAATDVASLVPLELP